MSFLFNEISAMPAYDGACRSQPAGEDFSQVSDRRSATLSSEAARFWDKENQHCGHEKHAKVNGY